MLKEQYSMSNQGSLYLVATPIGNLGDMTPRAVEVLNDVDVIAAEDTRHSGKLLQHFGIRTPCLAYHEHNERQQCDVLVARLQAGESIALISDAGTPLVSDPGFHLVRAARQAGVTVVPVPGASALIAALSVSGLPSDRFVFEGFLPAKTAARCQRLQVLANDTRTLIFYESPHRIEACLADMVAVFGPERHVVVARELTKRFESIHDDRLGELPAWLAADENRCRGEFVVLVEGAAQAQGDETDAEVQRLLTILMEELPLKQAAALAARVSGRKKNALYQLALELSGK